MFAASAVGAVALSRGAADRLAFSRAAFVGLAGELLPLALWNRRALGRSLRLFFTESADPLNLAIFRIALFAAILLEIRLPAVISLSRVPAGLEFAPWGMERILPRLSIGPDAARAAGIALTLFAVTGLLGLFSRSSALGCVVAGFYVLGIPHFFGKVDHDHHLLWFAAILTVSPCGDALALDALLASRRRGGLGGRAAPPPSRAYALPLRLVMLLIGAVYFFPGFWKLWQGGFDWFLSDNLARQLHLFWTWSFGGQWLPAFRLDRHILLCRAAAAATVLFELSFLFLIFSRRLRVIPPLAGLAFHAATNAFMGISFLSLRLCYAAFFDWKAIFGRVARAFGLPPSHEPSPAEDSPPRFPGTTRTSIAAIASVGGVLLLGAVWGGATRNINGWPFACYPTFARSVPDRVPTLTMAAVGPSGEETVLDEPGLSYHRYYGLARNILAIADPADRNDRLTLLWRRAAQVRPGLARASAVKFYADEVWIDPDRRPRLASRRLIFVYHPPAGGGSARHAARKILPDLQWQ